MKFIYFSILLLVSIFAQATVYVYELPDGSKLITDQKQYKKGYRLKNSVKPTPFRSSNQKHRGYDSKTIQSQYDAIIKNTALKYSLEPAFIKAIIHVESAFDRFAISHAGAMGLMQLMPSTAANYQLNQDQFDAHRNIDVGVQHMKDLMIRYNDDKRLSLAAYNAGEAAVSRYKGVPPYKETQSYIKKVLRLYKLYKNKAENTKSAQPLSARR